MRFKINDRVIRPADVYNPRSPLLHGKIIRVYGEYSTFHTEDLGPWYYEELYEVQWDSGIVQKGFLPHGLNFEEEVQ